MVVKSSIARLIYQRDLEGSPFFGSFGTHPHHTSVSIPEVAPNPRDIKSDILRYLVGGRFINPGVFGYGLIILFLA